MRLTSEIKKKTGGKLVETANRFALPLQFAGSFLVYFVIEWISRHSFAEAWQFLTGSPLVFLFNTLLIFATSSVAFLFRKRVFVRALVFLFWIFLGTVNGVILLNRVTPFTGPDLQLIDDARKIAKNYLSPLMIILIVAGIVLLIALLVFLFFKTPRYEGKRRLPAGILIIACSFALLFGVRTIELNNRIISNYFGNIAFAYKDYGFPYCFLVTLLDTGISQPNGYSEKLVEQIIRRDLDGDLDESSGQAAGEKTNIIFLQLESFMDPEQVEFLKLSDDPIPNFRALSEKYSSGNFRVPVVGAGTVNTEFECITGMSLHFFGAGEYPYKTILKEQTCESIPYVLKELGYRTHAVHNNEAKFYTRSDVFKNLGFDTFTSEEYITNTSDVTPTGWLRDRVLTNEIISCMEETEDPDYIYTISVQGHGDYPSEPVLDNPVIDVEGAGGREQNNYSWEYYCQQVHEMDEFVRELTDTLAEYPEPVILIMYGDHLPTMGLETRDIKGRYLFQTQYVMWDNFGLPVRHEDLTSYQIGAEVLDRLGIHKGTIPLYHQNRRSTRNYQLDFEVLQYDILYGENYSGCTVYEPTGMQMGIRPIVLNYIEQTGDGSYVVHGANFTEASCLEVDGELITDTARMNSGRLFIPEAEFTGTEMVAVAQRSSSTQTKAEVLSRTDPVPVSGILRSGQLQKTGS